MFVHMSVYCWHVLYVWGILLYIVGICLYSVCMFVYICARPLRRCRRSSRPVTPQAEARPPPRSARRRRRQQRGPRGSGRGPPRRRRHPALDRPLEWKYRNRRFEMGCPRTGLSISREFNQSCRDLRTGGLHCSPRCPARRWCIVRRGKSGR